MVHCFTIIQRTGDETSEPVAGYMPERTACALALSLSQSNPTHEYAVAELVFRHFYRNGDPR
jgi:hypothetical protein